MKKSDLIAVFGSCESIGEQFSRFNEGKPLTKQAVSQWEEDIPPLREYQLRDLMPDIDRRIARARRLGALA